MPVSPVDTSLMRAAPKVSDLVQQMKQNVQKSEALIEQGNNSTRPVAKTQELVSQAHIIAHAIDWRRVL